MPPALLQYPQRELPILEFYLHANNLRTLLYLLFLTQHLTNKIKLNTIFYYSASLFFRVSSPVADTFLSF
jgi:hypothetical protein